MTKYLMYDEEVISILKKIAVMIPDVKTRFDHVRGDVEYK